MIGFIAMLLLLAWMSVMAWQRPVPYGERVDTAPWPDARINVNTASEVELTVLPNIGPRLAERIVDDRNAHGPFESLDELTRVPFIGPRTVESISRYAKVSVDEHQEQREVE